MESGSSRQLLPKPPHAPFRGGAGPPPPRMPRAKRILVPIACDRCRKRKTKCNGLKPSCQGCIRGGLECHYSAITTRAIREAFEAIRQGTEPELLDMLRQLKEIQPPDDEEKSATKLPSRTISPQNGPSEGGKQGIVESMLSRGHVFDAASVGNGSSLQTVTLPVSQWTTVSGNDEMLTHLITLFWTWDNILTKVIDRGMFLQDLCSGPGNVTILEACGQDHFCSALLVNAVLAVSTFYSDAGEYSGKLLPQSRAFADESHRLLHFSEKPLLPLMQGVALLWLYETNVGNSGLAVGLRDRLFQLHESSGFDRLEAFRYVTVESERAIRARHAIMFSAWGFYCLDSNICLALGRPMQVQKPILPNPLPPNQKRAHGVDALDDIWFDYPSSSHSQPSHRQELLDLQCDLAVLAEKILSQVEINRQLSKPDYTPSMELYSRLLEWKASLIEKFNHKEAWIPIRTFLCVSSRMLIIKLLEAFTELPLMLFDGLNGLAQILNCSESIVSDLHKYNTAFRLRGDYCMIQACRIAAITVLPHLAPPGSPQERTFVRSCELLHLVGKNLPIANNILASLRSRIVKSDIAVPAAARRLLATRTIQESSEFAASIGIANEAVPNAPVEVTLYGSMMGAELEGNDDT